MIYINQKVNVAAQGKVGISPSLLPSVALAGGRVFHTGARGEARFVYLAGALY